MGGNRRLMAALEMSEETRRVALAGFHALHPDWPPARVERAVAELLIGDKLPTSSP
jgi:hypothetical protein